VPADPQTLGWTEPGPAGRRYRHGTTTAYGLGRCRCEHCRHAVASYRAQRRRNGHDRPSQGHPAEADPHLHASTFRTSVLRPALRAAGIDGVTFHGLRHAHASWLQMSRIAFDASFGSSREHTLPAPQRAGLRCCRAAGAPHG
jgi:integrase